MNFFQGIDVLMRLISYYQLMWCYIIVRSNPCVIAGVYTVIGVLESLLLFLEMLECAYPSILGGITQLYLKVNFLFNKLHSKCIPLIDHNENFVWNVSPVVILRRALTQFLILSLSNRFIPIEVAVIKMNLILHLNEFCQKLVILSSILMLIYIVKLYDPLFFDIHIWRIIINHVVESESQLKQNKSHHKNVTILLLTCRSRIINIWKL
jgi:hypothetical protein